MQLVQNRICGGGPLEWLAVGVVGSHELVDALHQLLDAGERSPADGLIGDQRKEALHLIEPGAVGGDEVHVPARACRQPRLDLGMVVRGVVVADAVDVQISGHGLLDLAQEGQELLMPMARLAGSQHRAIEHVQRGKQRGRAVTLVVMGDALDVAKAHGEHRLRALQRLALTLLVHADDQSVIGRAQVQPHHIAQLLDEERVGGQFEALAAVRLQAKELEVARHAGLGDAGLSGHRANAPVRGAVGRLGVQRGVDQLGQALVIDGARRARAHIVIKPANAPLDESSAPLAHRVIGQLQP